MELVELQLLEGREDSPWTEAQTTRIEDHEEAPLPFPEPVLAWFSLQTSGLEARERNMTLTAKANRYQLDLVEQEHAETVPRR